MGWLNRIPDGHDQCDQPGVHDAGIGSTWECDTCGKIYRLSQDRFYCRSWEIVA